MNVEVLARRSLHSHAPDPCSLPQRDKDPWPEATELPHPAQGHEGSQGGFLQEVELSKSPLGRAGEDIQAGE